ncbi:hypothetical protein CSUI_002870 [Cystoisospora suis]|uniref:Uncharacterized protein n=1 Tax=Cystoisospora suis TaxID=483139 RepID=A0A2C6KSE3_9APIC|nr:hypothetical protein CSUI_002870 [Cystoisospora suis]
MDSFAFDDSFTYFPSCSLPPPSSSSSFDGVSSSFSPPDHHNSTSSSSRFPLLPSFSDSLENSSQSFWPSFSNSQHPSLRSLSSCPSPSGLPASPILSSSPCPGPPNSSLSSLSFSQQSFSSVLKSVSQRSSPSLGASSPPPSLGLETSISKEERHVFLPSPFSLHDFAHLPFLCSRVYVQFAADGVLPPEVKLALRHPHGYEYTVREPRGGSTSKRERRKEVKHEETSPSRPSIPLCPSQPSSSHTESSAPESRLSSSPVGCTDTCTSRGRPDGGATGGASSVSKNHDSCDCSSCRLSRAIEEAAKILRPYGVSIVRDSRLLGHSDYPRAPSEAPSQTPNAFLPLTPPSLPLNTKSSSSSISSSPSSPQLALVPYSSPCKEVSLSALLPGRSSFSTCSSSSTSSSAPPVVGMLIRKTAVTSSRQHRETGSDAPSSSPSSSSSSSPSLSSFPPDIVHEVVRELKKGLTCFVLRGAPPVTPLPGVRTPAPPASSPSTSKAISVSTAIKREKLHSKTGDLRGDAQGKGRARTAGGVSSTENGDPHASSTSGWGEASRGLKSSFDGDCEVLEGWIDAILQLHDMEDEDRQTLVVTNHYAGIFSHKRAVLTHTSYEFGSLLFRDPALKFSSVYGSRNADDSCSSSSTKTTSRKSSRAEPGGGASFWSSSGQKGTRSEVNEVLQLIPGFLLKTLFFDGATSQVRPLLRFLRRHASVSLSLTTGGGMLGGGPGSSVNSCAYFSSFRKAASAVLSSSSSSQSRRPSTRARRKEENEERKEEGSEEEDEESEGEKKDATRSRMPESAGPHSKNKHHTSLNGSEGSASHLDAQERTTKKPLKVFLVISTFPMRHSRVRVARTDIDDRIAEDVTTRKATRRLRIRGSLLPRSLERILRAFTLLTSSSSSSCCSSSFSLQHSSSFSSFSSTSSLPADSSSNIPCLSKGDSKAFPNKTRQEEKVDEVSAPQYYLKDLSLLFSFKAHPHAGAPFADEELALCLPSQLVSQQFSRFGWLLQQKHSSVYTRLRSLLPPSSWAQDATASQLADSGVATKESLDGFFFSFPLYRSISSQGGSSLLGKGAVLSGGLLALTAGDEVEEEEERWREVSEAITSFCMMMLQNSLDLKKNFPILCRPIVEVRQVLQWLKRNNKPQIQGLRLCTSLYPYRFHTASGQASSASSASALLTLLKDLSPEHFISQHYLHLVSTFSSLLASQSTTIDKQKAPGLLLKGGEEEEQRGAPFIMHVDLFGVCRPSWIRELKALTRSFEGNQYLSISWKQGQRGVSDYLLWIGSPSPPSPLSRSEEMLRSVLCTALSSRDSCGPLLKSECILDHVKDLETAVCQLKQRRPSIEERDSSLHEAKRLHRVNVYAAITSQRLLRLLSSSFSSSSSSTSSPPKNADSSVTTSAFRPVQQQGVFRSLQKDLRDLNRLKETQKSRGIDVQIHLVSPGWAYECYHMGSLRPSTGPLYYLDVLVEKKVASIKEENLEKEKENVTASKTSTSHRSPQSIPSVASLRGKQKNRSVSSSQEKKKAQEEDDQLQDERKKESLFSTSSEEEEEDHPQEKRRTDTESSKQEENEVRRSGRETIHGKREGAKKIEAEKREENSDEKTQEISICKGLTLRDEVG